MNILQRQWINLNRTLDKFESWTEKVSANTPVAATFGGEGTVDGIHQMIKKRYENMFGFKLEQLNPDLDSAMVKSRESKDTMDWISNYIWGKPMSELNEAESEVFYPIAMRYGNSISKAISNRDKIKNHVIRASRKLALEALRDRNRHGGGVVHGVNQGYDKPRNR